MQFNQICITGGAGFVGSNLAILFKQAYPDCTVTAFDSLKRRGSELTLPRLKAHGIAFIHGDIRCPEDMQPLPRFNLLIDCSAEPSVQAGVGGDPLFVLNTNLVGTINCLEAARRRDAAFLFLSTSRVYPIAPLNGLHYTEQPSRFTWSARQKLTGCSDQGISEDFPLQGARSLYGASKLAGELLLQEYVYNYGMPGLINRCGILTGPWQMGKVDQGVITLWVARHYFERGLKYIGYSGQGKQVRDVLHVDDLFDLLQLQLADPGRWDGRFYNVGGGREVSVSLLELTEKCRAITGKTIPMQSQPETSSVDLRIYLTDARRVAQEFTRQPRRGVDTILKDIHQWIRDHESLVKPVFA